MTVTRRIDVSFDRHRYDFHHDVGRGTSDKLTEIGERLLKKLDDVVPDEFLFNTDDIQWTVNFWYEPRWEKAKDIHLELFAPPGFDDEEFVNKAKEEVGYSFEGLPIQYPLTGEEKNRARELAYDRD